MKIFSIAVRNLSPLIAEDTSYEMVQQPRTNPKATSEIKELVIQQQQQQGIIDISDENGLINDYPVPSSFNVTVTSVAGGGGGSVQMNLFNETYLTTSPTNNGSGANSVVKTYSDGFSGRVYEQYAKLGKGILIKGFTIVSTINSTGAQSSTIFNTMALQLLIANGKGGLKPYPIDFTEALRNTQQQMGTLTVRFPFYLSSLSQVVYQQAIDSRLAWTFFTATSKNI